MSGALAFSGLADKAGRMGSSTSAEIDLGILPLGAIESSPC